MSKELMKRVETLEKQLQELAVYKSLVQKVVESQGIRGSWLTPSQAAPILGISEDRINYEIKLAERLRVGNKRGDCLLGVHYRNIQNPEAQRPCWQINVLEFEKLLAIPPEKRKVS